MIFASYSNFNTIKMAALAYKQNTLFFTIHSTTQSLQKVLPLWYPILT